MKTIDSIIIHCSATREGQDITARDIDMMHRQRGFNEIGYNYVVKLNGDVETGRSLLKDGAHCNNRGFGGLSYNKHSIGICYVGGLDANGKAKDTRTEAQKRALRVLVAVLCGLAKEFVYDRWMKKGTFDRRDFLADGIGIALGLI